MHGHVGEAERNEIRIRPGEQRFSEDAVVDRVIDECNCLILWGVLQRLDPGVIHESDLSSSTRTQSCRGARARRS